MPEPDAPPTPWPGARPSLQPTAEPGVELSAQRFRRATARYATGIAVVTTVADGVDHAMTANSFTSVSLDPLLALVCVERDSRFHGAVLAAGIWVVSFLPEGQEATARWFATRGRPLAGQFDRVPTRRAANGCLLLTEGLAALEMTTHQVVRAGDHDVLIGAVTEVHDAVEGRPLVYFGSAFLGIG